MQVSVCFPDSGFPDITFTVNEDTLVKYAAQTAADE